MSFDISYTWSKNLGYPDTVNIAVGGVNNLLENADNPKAGRSLFPNERSARIRCRLGLRSSPWSWAPLLGGGKSISPRVAWGLDGISHTKISIRHAAADLREITIYRCLITFSVQMSFLA